MDLWQNNCDVLGFFFLVTTSRFWRLIQSLCFFFWIGSRQIELDSVLMSLTTWGSQVHRVVTNWETRIHMGTKQFSLSWLGFAWEGWNEMGWLRMLWRFSYVLVKVEGRMWMKWGGYDEVMMLEMKLVEMVGLWVILMTMMWRWWWFWKYGWVDGTIDGCDVNMRVEDGLQIDVEWMEWIILRNYSSLGPLWAAGF
jgi:hypothetical protein